MGTRIEWADEVWNPVTGCTKVSPGCAHCYAERLAGRFWGERKFTDVQMHPERLEIPLRWQRPRRVFVNSMSDLFHERVPEDFIREVFWAMDRARRHTFMVLTKRQERMWAFMLRGVVLPNVWLGVSAEDQRRLVERMPAFLDTPAAVRFVSLEPLLGPIQFRSYELRKLGWVIVGGESGPGARPMEADWARSVRDQCQEAGTPFFFKQWGGARPGGERLLDGREWREFPDRES